MNTCQGSAPARNRYTRPNPLDSLVDDMLYFFQQGFECLEDGGCKLEDASQRRLVAIILSHEVGITTIELRRQMMSLKERI
jgi:hypothetical protein